jgi:hypothetical protein
MVGAAGLLWLSTRPDERDISGYVGKIAVLGVGGVALGLAMSLSATLGTLVVRSARGAMAAAILLTAVASLAGIWVLTAHAPDGGVATSVRGWSDDIGILGIVEDFEQAVPTVAFGVGVLVAQLLALFLTHRSHTRPPALASETETGENETTREIPAQRAA